MQSETQFLGRFRGNISLYLKREDLLHSEVSGNKFRKLKYNILKAQELKYTRILTFGGAFSNHIAATAAAAKLYGMESIGIIRGEELALEEKIVENPTLRFSASCGMKLCFLSREDYRRKEEPEIIDKLKAEIGEFFLVPEGGTNELAVKGCTEILTEADKEFNFVCCAVGTGGTIAGLINSSAEEQQILGFPALKGDFLSAEIKKFTRRKNWQLITDYHFGGYAKLKPELVNFINDFREEYNVQLDPVYTGKLLFGIFDLLEKSYFPENSRILAVHTGGLQGIAGMNQVLRKKKMPLIKTEL
ncbi:MAG: pyridoxal-phosphate dependent enzyme [Salegentibacter sp.]